MAEQETVKVFSKAAWLASANEQKAAGTLTQREIDDALVIWVNDLDGKTEAEIAAAGENSLRDDWFVEVVAE
jgi:hypothetical protein